MGLPAAWRAVCRALGGRAGEQRRQLGDHVARERPVAGCAAGLRSTLRVEDEGFEVILEGQAGAAQVVSRERRKQKDGKLGTSRLRDGAECVRAAELGR